MGNKTTPPMRMCFVCRGLFPKGQLVRIVRTPEGEYCIDLTGKKSGRGCYVCKCDACISSCIKGKFLNKAFKTKIEDSVYEKLKEEYVRLQQ